MILPFLLLIPLLAGVCSGLARTRRAMETVNLAGFTLTFAASLLLAGEVLAGGPVSMWDGFLYADHLSALVCLLTASMAAVCAV